MTGAGSRLIFTWLHGHDGKPANGRGFDLLAAILALTGEPWQWLELNEIALAQFLADTASHTSMTLRATICVRAMSSRPGSIIAAGPWPPS